MKYLEDKAHKEGYRRLILQTREIMTDAVGLYEKMGYHAEGEAFDEQGITFMKMVKEPVKD